MRKLIAVMVIVAASLLWCADGVSAGDKTKLLFDRGLPTANYNNTGLVRSNVAWADAEPSIDPKTGYPAEYWLPGDDFIIQQPGEYRIKTIRVWITGDVPDGDGKDEGEHKGHHGAHLTLWGGTYSSGIGPISTTYSVTPVAYANGEGYLGNSGAIRQINQVDFKVHVDLSGGEAFTFFVDGPWTPANIPSLPGWLVNPFLHASDRVTSGVVQPGANDWFLWLHRNDQGTVGVENWNAKTGAGTLCAPSSCAGDSHPSDANVQVFGEMYKKSW